MAKSSDRWRSFGSWKYDLTRRGNAQTPFSVWNGRFFRTKFLRVKLDDISKVSVLKVFYLGFFDWIENCAKSQKKILHTIMIFIPKSNDISIIYFLYTYIDIVIIQTTSKTSHFCDDFKSFTQKLTSQSQTVLPSENISIRRRQKPSKPRSFANIPWPHCTRYNELGFTRI